MGLTVESVPGGERGDARGVDVGMEEKVGRKLISLLYTSCTPDVHLMYT